MSLCVLVPARNEAGHLEHVVSQILMTHGVNEIIVIEGGSIDNTWQEALILESSFPERVRAIKQSSRGKFNAVLEGAASANSDLVFIWDADGTVSQIDNQKIISESLNTGSCVLGDRLKGNIHPGAMQMANWIANHMFAMLWAPFLGFRKMDLLCGSKVFPRIVYMQIPDLLKSIDPYGDFSLVISARLMKLKITSQRVDYFPRTYGVTNIHRWSGGIRLIITSLFSFYYLTKSRFFKK